MAVVNKKAWCLKSAETIRLIRLIRLVGGKEFEPRSLCLPDYRLTARPNRRIITVVVDGRFYTALLSAVEQTQCAHVAYVSE